MATTTTLEATITRTNGRGFQIAEQPGAWLNISRYADPGDVQVPPVGARVTLVLDGQGFVRRIGPASAAPATSANGQAGTFTSGPASTFAARPGKEVVIARLAVLNTATSILASGGRPADAKEVIALAEVLEAWATR